MLKGYLVRLLIVYLFGNFTSINKRQKFFCIINIENLFENISHFHFGYSLKCISKNGDSSISIKEVWNEDVTDNWHNVSQGLFTTSS